MTETSPFSSRLVFALAGSMLAAFGICFFLFVYGGAAGPDEAAGSNSSSPSAIGHAGFYELLRRSGIDVARGGTGAVDQVGTRGLLVVAEPDLRFLTAEDGLRLKHVSTILLVLPKWSGSPDQHHAGWISQAAPLPVEIAQEVARFFDNEATVARLPAAQSWTVDRLGVTPEIGDEVQLIRSPNLTPVIGSPSGMLVGEMDDDGRKILVLADPDAIENHGLFKGDNARFGLALIQSFSQGGLVLFDETVHGAHDAPANPIRMLFQFPFVIATIGVAITVLLLLLATMTRFGRPWPAPARLTFGKDSLIRNSAALLDHGGHQAVVLKRYAHVALGDAGRLLHAPPQLDEPGLAAWLDRVGTARGVTLQAAEILARVDAEPGGRNLTRLFAAARDMHRWKRDLTNGS